MSMASDDLESPRPDAGDAPNATAPETEALASEPPPPRSGWRLVSMIPNDGEEPTDRLTERMAQAAWCAVSALWHPSLLSRACALPVIERIESPTPCEAREIRLIPEGAAEHLPSGYRTQAGDAGTLLLEAGEDRAALIRTIQEHLGAVGTPETSDDQAMIDLANDFLAIGTTQWLVRDLSIAMGHADSINHEALTREVLTGADAWQACDRPAAVNRLRAAFEVLTQARERYYPVDAYLVDLCLLDPSLPAGSIARAIEIQAPISFIAPARAIESQARLDPPVMERLHAAITNGWVDIAGGTYAEIEDSLLPLGSILWQFRRGGEVYREHLEERNVETYARRRFGLFTQLPQLAKRHGFRFALHLALDSGKFPVRSDVKQLWESPDGTCLESLLRPPIAGDQASEGLKLPWRLAATMKSDHVATVPLAHWPSPVASWYRDLRRGAAYSPVLARWITLNDYFHNTDRPYQTFRPSPDSYVSPYLAQAAARGDDRPISRFAEHHQLRARFEAVHWLRAIAMALRAPSTPVEGNGAIPPEQTPSGSLDAVEAQLETGEFAAVQTAIVPLEQSWGDALRQGIVSGGAFDPQSAPQGFLVINPLGVARRVAVTLENAAIDLRTDGPLRAAQFTDEGVQGVVDVPAFGFAWVHAKPRPDAPSPSPATLSAQGRTLSNGTITIEIDEATGGLRGVSAAGEPSARLGQQLAVTGLVDPKGQPVASMMKSERFDVDYAGPALLQAVSSGVLSDAGGQRRLAEFTQRYRLWSGRPMLEIDLTLSSIDPAWIEQAMQSDPWSAAIVCRWAWPDQSSTLRRTVMLSPEVTTAARPETPGAFDLSTRHQRTALLFGGLPYHQRHGQRMLDTLLVAGAESARSFRLGVVLDLEHPFQAAQDFLTPAVVIPCAEAPPEAGKQGWLMRIDQKAAAVTHVEFVEAANDGRGWGLVVHLLETAGRSSRCRVQFFRNPTWARQVDFLDDLIIDLSVEEDGVLVDLTPNELLRLEVTFG